MCTHVHTPTTYTYTNVCTRIPIWWATEFQVVCSHPAGTHIHIHTTTHTYIQTFLHTHTYSYYYHTHTSVYTRIPIWWTAELQVVDSHPAATLTLVHTTTPHTHIHTYIYTHTYYYYYTRKHMYILEYQYDVLRSCKSFTRSPLLYHTRTYYYTHTYTNVYTRIPIWRAAELQVVDSHPSTRRSWAVQYLAPRINTCVTRLIHMWGMTR